MVAVFQPAEEAYAGSRVMLANGIREAMPKPDVYLGQHVLPMLPAGVVGTHGSMPDKGVDPILLASNIVTRLHTVVSREIDAKDTAVLTVGAIHSGVKANVIPETAEQPLPVLCTGPAAHA